MWQHFTHSIIDDALPNCLNSWIHEYTLSSVTITIIVVVTNTQVYYYIGWFTSELSSCNDKVPPCDFNVLASDTAYKCTLLHPSFY